MLQENARIQVFMVQIVLQVTLCLRPWYSHAVPHRILQKSLKMIMELLLASFRLRNLLKVMNFHTDSEPKSERLCRHLIL